MTDNLPAAAERPEDRPAYLAEITPDKVDNSDLNAFAKPPRIKIVQGSTKAPIKPPFAEGDAIILPHMKKIADMETAFEFVPLHFFPSWSCINPYQLRSQMPTVREFSLDPRSEVAYKAKNFVRERCPENTEYELKYSESLNFIIAIEGIEEFDLVPVHIFFVRGEYATGQKLIGQIQLRKAPRYACRFRAAVDEETHKDKQGNEWRGLVIDNPPNPWVSQERFHTYEQIHKQLDQTIKARTIEIDTSDFESPETGESTEY